MQKNIINIVLFNAVWLVCVLGGSTVAVVAVLITIAFHMKFISTQPRELLFIALVALTGIIVECGFLYFGVLQSATGSVVPPIWLLALWPLFATTLNHSTRWFQDHLWVSAIAGGIAGTLTYYAGTRLTDYEIAMPFIESMIKLMIVWMVVFPGLMIIARRLNQAG